jgi:outer membrane lipoprotein SlyB
MGGGASDDRVVMKKESFVAAIVTVCVVMGQAGAPLAMPVPRKGSWQTVENVPRGTLVAVKTALSERKTEKVHCLFHEADDTELVCGHWSEPRPCPYPVSSAANPNRYVFARDQVIEVRVENEDEQVSQSTLAGAFAGATLGGITGYNCCGAKGSQQRSAAAFGLSVVGRLWAAWSATCFDSSEGR